MGESVWVATTNAGLMRYDSRLDEAPSQYLLYKDDVDMPRVVAIHRDKRGGIWLETEHGNPLLKVADGEVVENEKPIWGIRRDAQGDLWGMGEVPGGHPAGIYRLEDGNWVLQPYRVEPPTGWVLSGFARGEDGSTWVMGAGWFAAETGGEWKSYPATAYPVPGGLFRMEADDSGRVWMADGVRVITFKDGRFEGLPSPSGLGASPGLMKDVDGRIWIGAASPVTWDGEGWKPFRDSVSGGMVSGPDGRPAMLSAFTGPDGLWDLYTADTVLKYRPNATMRPGLPQLPVAALLEDGAGAAWVAVKTGGLFRLDDAGGVFPSVLGPDTSLGEVLSLIRDADGIVWAGTEAKGLAFREDGEWKWAPGNSAATAPRSIAEIAYHSEYGFLALTEKGLMVHDGSGWERFQPLSTAPSNQFTHLAVDRQGRVWLTLLPAGALRWDGAAWTFLEAGVSAPTDSLLGLHPDSSGGVWAFTASSLYRADQGEFRRPPEQACFDAEPHLPLRSLSVESDSVLWVGRGHYNGRQIGSRGQLVRAGDQACRIMELFGYPQAVAFDPAGNALLGMSAGFGFYRRSD